MIPVKVKGIAYDISGNPMILLTDREEEKVLPIWVGLLEAHSIAIALEKLETPRPLTHELMVNICSFLGAKISHVIISDLQDNTFFAELHITKNGHDYPIDARPSDAIALALRTAVPIYLSEKLVNHMLLIKDIIDEKDREELEKMAEELLKEHKKNLH